MRTGHDVPTHTGHPHLGPGAVAWVLTLSLVGLGLALALHKSHWQAWRAWQERPVNWEGTMQRAALGLGIDRAVACGVAVYPGDDAAQSQWVAVRRCEDHQAERGQAHWSVHEVRGGIDTHGWRLKIHAADGRRCHASLTNFSPSRAEIRDALGRLTWQCDPRQGDGA